MNGPGQPPRPSERDRSCLACAVSDSGCMPSTLTALRRARVSARNQRTSRPTAIVITGGSVLPCEADPLRRPQRPGKPARVCTLSGTLPAIHPRELPGTVSAFTMHLAKRLELSRLRESNVPQDEVLLKRKLYWFCAEAVEDREMLWKVTENGTENPPRRQGGRRLLIVD